VERTKSMSRDACRNAFEERFTARRMAKDYLKLYERMTEKVLPLRKSPMSDRSESEPVVEDAA
ncbi:MAG: hypothetical protein WBV41_04960, partial [Terriglobales bacterium]